MDIIQYKYDDNTKTCFKYIHPLYVFILNIVLACFIAVIVQIFKLSNIEDNDSNDGDSEYGGGETESETDDDDSGDGGSETEHDYSDDDGDIQITKYEEPPLNDDDGDDDDGGDINNIFELPECKELFLNFMSLLYLYSGNEALSMNTIGLEDIDEKITNVIVSRDLHIIH